MKEYVADQGYAKRLQKQRRKRYKAYRIARVILLVFLCAILLSNIYMLTKAENASQIPEILLLCLGLDLLLGIGAAISYAAIQGCGREFLMTRKAERCIFQNDCFVLEYVPFKGSEEKYNRIQHNFQYRNIRFIDCSDDYRITLHGTQTITKFYTENGKIFGDQIDTTIPLSVMDYYPEFDKIKDNLIHLAQQSQKQYAGMQ